MYVMGLQFLIFWNFNGIQTENDSYWQNNKFLFLQNVLKCNAF